MDLIGRDIGTIVQKNLPVSLEPGRDELWARYADENSLRLYESGFAVPLKKRLNL